MTRRWEYRTGWGEATGRVLDFHFIDPEWRLAERERETAKTARLLGYEAGLSGIPRLDLFAKIPQEGVNP